MKFIAGKTILTLAVWLVVAPKGFSQEGVPLEILQRTRLIQSGDSTGTGFLLDHKDKLYVVTARHMVTGLPPGKATIQVWQSDKWMNYQIVKTIFPASVDVDIAVLETEERVSESYKISPPGDGDGPTMGQQCWFLGYPFGTAALTSRLTSPSPNPVLPFIKRGTMSVIDGSNPSAVVLYIDGFNNPGFSGGPIIYWDFKKREYKIIGVVKGYKPDKAKVKVNGQLVDSDVLINSGILVGYSILHAVEAIENDLKVTDAPVGK